MEDQVEDANRLTQRSPCAVSLVRFWQGSSPCCHAKAALRTAPIGTATNCTATPCTATPCTATSCTDTSCTDRSCTGRSWALKKLGLGRGSALRLLCYPGVTFRGCAAAFSPGLTCCGPFTANGRLAWPRQALRLPKGPNKLARGRAKRRPGFRAGAASFQTRTTQRTQQHAKATHRGVWPGWHSAG